MKLSPIQEKIVETPGNLIVRASAGTGKTHTMVNKIAKEIDDNHTHKVIAAITFTIKAAQEIKDRLSVDVVQHFIGTNNSFVIEEVIKPFMKDVYGADFDLDMSTDYSAKVDTFQEAIEKIRNEGILCSYRDNKRNFIFDLAQEIVENSSACRLYLQAKYFKIYIDEYQDCDKSMHKFFMYLCDELNIETFVVGDEKQSIYIWRGAYPEAFKSIWNKPNFKKIFMGDNFRSCQQIQNYSNLLCDETRSLYNPTENIDNIVWLSPTKANWVTEVLSNIVPDKKSALLRFSNDNARIGASELTTNGLEYVYIPQTPIADITTDTAWLYTAIAKYLIIEKYSAYDVISEIPVEGNESRKTVSTVKRLLKRIEETIDDEQSFGSCVTALAEYLGYDTRPDHINKLFKTISDTSFHVAFEADKYKHIAITFHSSKGLEFEQVIVFAEDYRLSDMSSIYNHYVAVTRAKSKLIIVKLNNYQNIFLASDFQLDQMTDTLSNTNFNGITPEIKEILNKCPESDKTGYVYYSEERHKMEPALLKTWETLAEKNKENWTDYEKQIWEETKADNTVKVHFLGISEAVFDMLEWKGEKCSWDTFKSGDYVIVDYSDKYTEQPVSYYQSGETFKMEYGNGKQKDYGVIGEAMMPYSLDYPYADSVYITVMVPEEEYFTQTENQSAMYATIDAKKGEDKQVKEYIDKNVLKENDMINVSSVLDMKASFRRFVSKYYMIGSFLVVILAFIGIMNFFNTTATSVISRKKELALLEVVGMTKKQISKMLVAEGFLYLGGAFMIAVLLVVVGAKQILINTFGTAFFFRLHLTIVPCVLMIPILVGIAYVIPKYQFEKMSRESVVERIRKE